MHSPIPERPTPSPAPQPETPIRSMERSRRNWQPNPLTQADTPLRSSRRKIQRLSKALEEVRLVLSDRPDFSARVQEMQAQAQLLLLKVNALLEDCCQRRRQESKAGTPTYSKSSSRLGYRA